MPVREWFHFHCYIPMVRVSYSAVSVFSLLPPCLIIVICHLLPDPLPPLRHLVVSFDLSPPYPLIGWRNLWTAPKTEGYFPIRLHWNLIEIWIEIQNKDWKLCNCGLRLRLECWNWVSNQDIKYRFKIEIHYSSLKSEFNFKILLKIKNKILNEFKIKLEFETQIWSWNFKVKSHIEIWYINLRR